MGNARISVNVDSDVKQNAQKILGEMGIDLTTAIDSFLRTIVREERIPFELRTARAYQADSYQQHVRRELEQAKIEAADPSTQWQSHDDVMNKLKQQREARRGL